MIPVSRIVFSDALVCVSISVKGREGVPSSVTTPEGGKQIPTIDTGPDEGTEIGAEQEGYLAIFTSYFPSPSLPFS